MNYLLEFNGHRARDSPQHPPSRTEPLKEEKPAFVLPIANQDQRRVFAYLQKRGIAPQVIRDFIRAGLLYEDALHHNCVFVGREVGGQPRFASKRGTYDLDGPGFKGDVTGSDKSVAFPLSCDPSLDWVTVFPTRNIGRVSNVHPPYCFTAHGKNHRHSTTTRKGICAVFVSTETLFPLR